MSLFSTHPSMRRFHEVSKVIRVPQNGWCINVPVVENAVKMDDLEVHTLFLWEKHICSWRRNKCCPMAGQRCFTQRPG